MQKKKNYRKRDHFHELLKRILIAFSNLFPKIGYVQGMNFIVASLMQEGVDFDLPE